MFAANTSETWVAALSPMGQILQVAGRQKDGHAAKSVDGELVVEGYYRFGEECIRVVDPDDLTVPCMLGLVLFASKRTGPDSITETVMWPPDCREVFRKCLHGAAERVLGAAGMTAICL